MIYYSLIKLHADGAWWYHRGDTFRNKRECFQRYSQKVKSYDATWRVVAHLRPFPAYAKMGDMGVWISHDFRHYFNPLYHKEKCFRITKVIC